MTNIETTQEETVTNEQIPDVAETLVPETNEITDEIDYEAELLKAQQDKDNRRLGYASRKARQEVEETPELEYAEEPVDTMDYDSLADKVADRLKSTLDNATQSNLIETKLSEMSNGNDALKKLIRFHMDNTVNPTLSLNERIDASYAIANRKTITKKLNEINTSLKNRSQISNSGLGSSQEVLQKPGNNVISDNQMEDLQKQAEIIGKAANWTKEQKTKFIEKAIEKLAIRS